VIQKLYYVLRSCRQKQALRPASVRIQFYHLLCLLPYVLVNLKWNQGECRLALIVLFELSYYYQMLFTIGHWIRR